MQIFRLRAMPDLLALIIVATISGLCEAFCVLLVFEYQYIVHAGIEDPAFPV